MLRIVFVVVMMSLLSACLQNRDADAPFEPLRFVRGTPPDAGYKQWIAFRVLGERDAAYPIIWVTTRRLKREPPEFSLVLSSKEYENAATFTNLERCNFDQGLAPRGTLEVTMYKNGVEQTQCIAECRAALDYLFRFATSGGFAWNERRAKPFRILFSMLPCKG